MRWHTTSFAPLRDPSYRSWFFAQLLSAAGLQTQNVAAAWIVFERTHSGIALAALLVVSQGPGLFLSAQSGVLADRFDRRGLLIITQSSFLVISLALGVLALSGHIDLLTIYGLSLLAGLVSALDAPTRQVYAIDLVGADSLARVVGLYEVALAVARTLGPAVGGLLLGTIGAGACFLFNAATFVGPLVALIVYRPRFAPTLEERLLSGRGALRAGLAYALHSPAIRCCLAFACAATMIFNISVYYPVFASNSLGLGSAGYGLLVACLGIGSLPGALAAVGAPRPERPGRRVAVLGAATGVALTVTGLAPTAVIADIGAVLVGFTAIWFIASANTLVQLASSPAMRGRIMGLWTTALPGMAPVTGLLIGWLIDATTPRWAFWAIAASLAVLVIVSWRTLDKPDDWRKSPEAVNGA